ncbi:hypothetical protein [Streptomyces sp. BPTC-684]|uniref:hypothetical protein n=1 Tax=Streptomyces sp. BPTC-684 TaxID=3043734 RepID=UPI0024B1F76B|nr:hypothetical protein [Streptomyces sp. BPTC-684]WHM36020.1 hypothetical protein QIY60_03195 [Streptomyces sp. BPTC-684]
MTEEIFEYPVYVSRESGTSKPLLLFSAKATDIDRWVGVPQRRRLSDSETVGWQREESRARLRELAHFFSDERNVVQNPLLGALQDPLAVTFVEDPQHPNFGHLTIRSRSVDGLTLLDALERVCHRLEERVPALREHPLDLDRRRAILDQARDQNEGWHTQFSDEEDTDQEELAPEDLSSDSETVEQSVDLTSVLLVEETQILDFYQELKIRASILREMVPEQRPDTLAGFSIDAMLSYLRPIVLVDGQHRLHGAVYAAQNFTRTQEGMELAAEGINRGEDPDLTNRKVLELKARSLPISLLLDPSPSEHVFQFVVVNQKATPMQPALLGTIVSTSLSKEETEPVADRLRRAGIPFDDSQAVAYMTRSSDSPFKGLVQTGIGGDASGLLKWTVLKSLTAIFRELKGGKLFGQSVDFADLWRRKLLEDSEFVSAGQTLESKQIIWQAADGPWRDVAIKFFWEIRTRFGDDDQNSHNAWGNTNSNLYNKIHLTILSADYFQFLTDRDLTLSSVADVTETMDSWLQGVNLQYFNRDWRVGLKKDQKAVRERWAKVWVEYRKDPERLPRVENYKP